MNYTQAQIDRANAVSLEDFLRTQGETLIKSGREYRWNWIRWETEKRLCVINLLEGYGNDNPGANAHVR